MVTFIARPEFGCLGFPEGDVRAFEVPPRVTDATHDGALGGRAIAFRTRPSWSGVTFYQPLKGGADLSGLN